MDSIGPDGISPPRTLAGPAKPALLREINDSVALNLFLKHGTLSRSDIVRLTGVSKPTGSLVLARLEAAQLVVPVGVSGGRPGRAAQLYELNRRSAFGAALDVTPDQIHAQVADITGRVVGEHVLTKPGTAPGSGPASGLQALDAALANAGLQRTDLRCLVLGATGSYDAASDRLAYARQLPGWQGTGIVSGLQEQLDVAVLVENDVNLAAIAERRLGQAREFPDFFLFWVGDGIGGALVIDDRLHRGRTGGAGEVAFLQLPGAPVVRNVDRGDTGGFEDWAGAQQIIAVAGEHGLTGTDAVSVVSAAAKAATDHGFLDDLATRFALGLASVIAVLDPSAIILAGPIMAAGGDRLRTLIAARTAEVAVTTPPLLLSTVPGNAVLTGALITAMDRTRATTFSPS